jgi:YgiT-type zinc finger domain-containing protein
MGRELPQEIDQMKCLECKTGEPKSGKSTFTVERDGVLVVVRHVPALICDQCGAEYFDGSVTEALQTQVDAAVKAGGEINIREYSAA